MSKKDGLNVVPKWRGNIYAGRKIKGYPNT